MKDVVIERGAYDTSGKRYVGMTVKEALEYVNDYEFIIPEDCSFKVNEQEVDDTYVLKEGDNLIIHKEQGEKGFY